MVIVLNYVEILSLWGNCFLLPLFGEFRFYDLGFFTFDKLKYSLIMNSSVPQLTFVRILTLVHMVVGVLIFKVLKNQWRIACGFSLAFFKEGGRVVYGLSDSLATLPFAFPDSNL